MKKTFCDHCGTEIDTRNCVSNGAGLITESKKIGSPTLHIQIMLGKASEKVDGDFCKYCVIDAIDKLDDRPKQLHNNMCA